MATADAITMLQLKVAVCDAASVTRTVNGNVPLAVGVPLIRPVLALMPTPAGNAPAVNAHEYGVTPPAAVNCSEYGWLITPCATGQAFVIATAEAITILQLNVAVWDAASVTRTVKMKFPFTEGVPLINPDSGVRLNPNGKSPDDTAQVTGAVPPTLASV